MGSWPTRSRSAKVGLRSFEAVEDHQGAKGVAPAEQAHAEVRVDRSRSSLTHPGSLVRKGCHVRHEVQMDSAEAGSQTGPDAVREPSPEQRTDRRTAEQNSRLADSHHGFAQERACIPREEGRHAVAAEHHGGCRGSRHTKPHCLIRRTASVSAQNGDAFSSGVRGCVPDGVAVAPPALGLLCERSGA